MIAVLIIAGVLLLAFDVARLNPAGPTALAAFLFFVAWLFSRDDMRAAVRAFLGSLVVDDPDPDALTRLDRLDRAGICSTSDPSRVDSASAPTGAATVPGVPVPPPSGAPGAPAQDRRREC